MAVDVTAVCDAAAGAQSSQTLAIVLSVMFSLYTVVTIILSALTIYSTSQAVEPAQTPTVVDALVLGKTVGASASLSRPLVSLRSQ